MLEKVSISGQSTAFAFALVGLVLYTIYGALWRLYLSPVAHISGPPFAILTFWNEFYYDVVLGGKYTWKISEYHERYGKKCSNSVHTLAHDSHVALGPIIRINPYEVHINDPDFYDEIYVYSNKGKTDKWRWSVSDHLTIKPRDADRSAFLDANVRSN